MIVSGYCVQLFCLGYVGVGGCCRMGDAVSTKWFTVKWQGVYLDMIWV